MGRGNVGGRRGAPKQKQIVPMIAPRRPVRVERQDSPELLAVRMRLVEKASIAQIAAELKITERDAAKFITTHRQTSKAALRKLKDDPDRAALETGVEIIAEIDALSRAAWGEYARLKDSPSERAKMLKLGLACVNRRISLLQELGIVPKVVQRIEVQAEHDIRLKWDDLEDRPEESAQSEEKTYFDEKCDANE